MASLTLERLQEQLVAMRERLLYEIQQTGRALLDDVAPRGELSNMPTHPADRDVEGLDEKIAIAQNEEHLLEQVEAALERVNAGTFGACDDCGGAIGEERLEAIPYAAQCIECARKSE
jgi:RNA polymerase-binding protein DksA